jgi:hypothetical protein
VGYIDFILDDELYLNQELIVVCELPTWGDELDILNSGFELSKTGVLINIDRKSAVSRSYEDLHCCKRLPWLLKERKNLSEQTAEKRTQR